MNPVGFFERHIVREPGPLSKILNKVTHRRSRETHASPFKPHHAHTSKMYLSKTLPEVQYLLEAYPFS